MVVTGASAGVGRATARRLAREGAHVCLIARESDGLGDAEEEVRAIGGPALAVGCDVADAEAVFRAANTCEERLGPIDVWVNNAMTTVFSPVADLSPDEARRVTEVTYLGYVHGTLAALRHMRPRDRGVIVQVGSSLAYRSIPLQAAYCGAKHAIRGFTDSMRSELMHEGGGIAVTAVHLPAVNTPQFDWARTHMKHEPRPVAPIYRARAAAAAIVEAARHPERAYWLGRMTPVLILADMVAPGLLDRYLANRAWQGQQTRRSADPNRPDNLFQSVSGQHRTDGAFSAEAMDNLSVYSPPAVKTILILGGSLMAGLLGAGAARLLQGRRNGGRP